MSKIVVCSWILNSSKEAFNATVEPSKIRKVLDEIQAAAGPDDKLLASKMVEVVKPHVSVNQVAWLKTNLNLTAPVDMDWVRSWAVGHIQ